MQEIRAGGFTVRLVRKNVRRMILHAAADGPWLSLPKSVSRAEAERFVTAESEWLARWQQELEALSVPRKGGMLYIWGRPFRFPEQEAGVTAEQLEIWYRRQLQEAVCRRLPHWEQVVGRRAQSCRLRKMKTRWGSCTVQTGAIRINTLLVRKPPACLDYVLAHELTHLHVPSHSAAFWILMDRFYPNWRTVRRQLNQGFGSPQA